MWFLVNNTVYIIVVTFNGVLTIRECLSSVRSSVHPVRCIVIDNASTDDTVSIIENDFPCVELIRSKENIGFGRANNIGLQRAFTVGTDFVFLLNQDAWIEPDTISELVRVSLEHPDYGIVSPVHMDREGQKLDAKFAHYLREDEYACPGYFSDLALGKELKQLYPVNFVNAAAWLVTRKCLNSVGGFCPLFFMYGEDDNYCQRVLRHGMSIGIAPNAYVTHARLSPSQSIQSPRSSNELQINRFVRKNMVDIFCLDYPISTILLQIIRISLVRAFDMLLQRKIRLAAKYLGLPLKFYRLKEKVVLHRNQQQIAMPSYIVLED